MISNYVLWLKRESQKDGERQKDLFFEKCPESSSIKENTFPLELQVDTQAKDICSPTEIQAKLSVKGLITDHLTLREWHFEVCSFPIHSF